MSFHQGVCRRRRQLRQSDSRLLEGSNVGGSHPPETRKRAERQLVSSVLRHRYILHGDRVERKRRSRHPSRPARRALPRIGNREPRRRLLRWATRNRPPEPGADFCFRYRRRPFATCAKATKPMPAFGVGSREECDCFCPRAAASLCRSRASADDWFLCTDASRGPGRRCSVCSAATVSDASTNHSLAFASPPIDTVEALQQTSGRSYFDA